jgi:hypothetical protein
MPESIGIVLLFTILGAVLAIGLREYDRMRGGE